MQAQKYLQNNNTHIGGASFGLDATQKQARNPFLDQSINQREPIDPYKSAAALNKTF